MNKYEHARKAVKSAIWRLQSSPLYYEKTMVPEEGVSEELHLKILKKNILNIVDILVADLYN